MGEKWDKWPVKKGEDHGEGEDEGHTHTAFQSSPSSLSAGWLAANIKGRRYQGQLPRPSPARGTTGAKAIAYLSAAASAGEG